MHTAIYERLKDIARAGDTTTYAAVAPLAGLDMAIEADRDTISKILDEINRHEHARGAPLLSSLVILADKNLPGRGYLGADPPLKSNLYETAAIRLPAS